MTSSGFTFGDGSTLESAAPTSSQVGGYVYGVYNGNITTPVSQGGSGEGYWMTNFAPGTTGTNFVTNMYATWTLANGTAQTQYPTPNNYSFVRSGGWMSWNTSYGIPASGTSLSPTNYYQVTGALHSSRIPTVYHSGSPSGSWRSVAGFGGYTYVYNNGKAVIVMTVAHMGSHWQRYA